MNWQRFIRKCKAAVYVVRTKAYSSFSQAGEDLIVHYLFQKLKMNAPTYLDVGANLPIVGSNTYFFYNRGSKGVCVEPDPSLYSAIKKTRPVDVVLNVGIGFGNDDEADFYNFPHPYTGWNTFSKEDANKKQKESGIAIKDIKKIPLKNINEIIKTYFHPHPNFISIDIEGLDLQVLQSLDFDRFKPEVICAETITFSINNTEEKRNEIAEFLQSKNYFVFADTHINTIFCRIDAYKNIP
jgi:FkbM family methyltransferase